MSFSSALHGRARKATAIVGLWGLGFVAAVHGQQPAASTPPSTPVQHQAPPAAPVGAQTPPNYVIGVDDVLSIVFWRDKEMSADVIVRPDGRITLPLLNDIQAAGLTPEQLRQTLIKEADRFIEDPAASVVVKEIHSLKVFITGEVQKPGPYALTSPMTVIQLIAVAGGLTEYAHRKDIVIVRNEGGRPQTYEFDYTSVTKRSNLDQNRWLKPGDTVVVP